MAELSPSPPRAQALRHFGRFQLLQLLCRSARSMLWLVTDPRDDRELVLAMPRARPADAAALNLWRMRARHAARTDHPALAPVLEASDHEGWPYITYQRGLGVTLTERLGAKGLPAGEAVPIALQLIEALAYAHEAGIAHLDVQAAMLLLPEQGPARLMGLAVALGGDDAQDLQVHRAASQRDVLAAGLVLHHMLAGQPVLGQADLGLVIDLLPPAGRELARLPWTLAQPVPEALRAIVNRATDRQPRQRYRSARTLQRALEGWLTTHSDAGGGPLALLVDRMRAAGALPAMPGGAGRVAQLATMDRERTNELADVVLKDIALAFELMRMINSAEARSAMVAGSSPVLTIRRAIAMLGLDGVRQAANALRSWPGPLDAVQAAELQQLVARVQRAGQIAQWLRPPGYDAEVVTLLALLQNLGRLLLQYHFPDEAAQVRRLMNPAAQEGNEPGWSEEAAAQAVLGVDIESIGAAVARLWGFDEGVLHMIRRPSAEAPVHAGDADDEMLRLVAACANEVVDLAALPAPRQAGALHRIGQRYARVLHLTQRDLQLAANGIDPASVGNTTANTAAAGHGAAA